MVIVTFYDFVCGLVAELIRLLLLLLVTADVMIQAVLLLLPSVFLLCRYEFIYTTFICICRGTSHPV